MQPSVYEAVRYEVIRAFSVPEAASVTRATKEQSARSAVREASSPPARQEKEIAEPEQDTSPLFSVLFMTRIRVANSK